MDGWGGWKTQGLTASPPPLLQVGGGLAHPGNPPHLKEGGGGWSPTGTPPGFEKDDRGCCVPWVCPIPVIYQREGPAGGPPAP